MSDAPAPLPLLSSTTPRRAVRFTLAAVLAVLAANAVAGGIYGVSGAAAVPREWLSGTPFSSYLVPSLVLLVVVGGASGVAAVGVGAAAAWDRVAAFVAGGVVLAWIAAQVWIIGYVSWLQPAVSVAGLLVVALAALLPPDRAAAHSG